MSVVAAHSLRGQTSREFKSWWLESGRGDMVVVRNQALVKLESFARTDLATYLNFKIHIYFFKYQIFFLIPAHHLCYISPAVL